MEKPIVFKNKNGKQLMGILHVPGGQKKFPLVVFCHGFGGTKTKRKYVRLARALEKKGIASFRFDFEGCGDSEGSPRDLTAEKEVSDLNFALKAVLNACNVDSKRIAFIGGSLGGVITSSFVERFKISAKALVLLAPAFNQKELFRIWYTKEDLKEIEGKGFLIKGEKEIGRDYYLENRNKDYSPVLSKINLPILLIHGKKDEDVPLKFSEELAEKYENITLKVLPDANHKFDDLTTQEKLVKLTVN